MERLRARAASLASTVCLQGGEGVSAEQRAEFADILSRWTAAGGDSSDVVVSLGRELFGAVLGGATTNATSEGGEPSTSSSHPPTVPPTVRVEFDLLEAFMRDTLVAFGVPEEEANVAADVLIEADKRGIDSHGIGRLKPIYCDRIDAGILRPTAPLEVVKETETTALVDGNIGLGLVIGPRCMQMAIDKAKRYGVGFVCAKNSTHYGIAGYYATMATQQGCIGMTGTNARPSIAPTFGVEPMLGTNPLCFGLPSDDDFPFVIDCATSVNQRGKIEKYEREGKPTPYGQVIDRDGNVRTDTKQILIDMVQGNAALCPLGGAGDEMGGYKGYGWATTVELLSCALQSGPWGEELCGIDRSTGEKKSMPLGHFFLAINVEAFVDLETFKDKTGEVLRALRASAKDPQGPGRIYTAGELEHEARLERTANGGTPVPHVLQGQMVELRDRFPALAEKYPKLPFED